MLAKILAFLAWVLFAITFGIVLATPEEATHVALPLIQATGGASLLLAVLALVLDRFVSED